MMTRAVDENLGFPMPASLAEMHRQMGKGDPPLLTVLPGSVAVPGDTHVGKKLLMFFATLILAGALIPHGCSITADPQAVRAAGAGNG